MLDVSHHNRRRDVSAQCGITGATIKVVGSVPGITAETFTEFAEKTKSGCPVSQALSGIEKTLEVSFEG
jgi:osmotically inducible protein OsmC